MNCPKCYTKIPDNQASCERCGWPDLAEKAQVTPATPRAKQAPSMAMTGEQRRYHFVKALFPFLVVTVPIIGIFTLVSPENFTLTPLLIFIGLIIAATYFNKHLHDFANDAVYVESDQLIKIDRVNVPRMRIYYIAFFKRLGDFQVDQELYNTVEPQSFYRIMYSPKSRKLWKVKIESNQAIVDNLLNEQQVSQSSNEDSRSKDRLSYDQRKEILWSMKNYIIIAGIIYFFTGNSMKRLLLWDFDNVLMPIILANSLFLLIFLNLIKEIIFQIIDLVTGKIESTIDTFIGFDTRRSSPGSQYTAKFQKLGKVSVNQQHYLEMVKGQKYQIFYSRWSKIVWDVQKTD